MRGEHVLRRTECGRHRWPTKPGPSDLYYLKRCAHLGERFVVEIRSVRWPGGFVDYVEDLPDGGLVVEAHSATRHPTYGVEVDCADELWEYLNGKMLAGEPPNPEEG